MFPRSSLNLRTYAQKYVQLNFKQFQIFRSKTCLHQFKDNIRCVRLVRIPSIQCITLYITHQLLTKFANLRNAGISHWPSTQLKKRQNIFFNIAIVSEKLQVNKTPNVQNNHVIRMCSQFTLKVMIILTIKLLKGTLPSLILAVNGDWESTFAG